MKRFSILIAIFFFVTPALAVNLNEEIKVGQNADKFIRKQFGVYPDKKIQAYVNRIGQKLLKSIEDPEFEYHFLVVDDPMLNAFAVPGGYVYITRGMLAYLDNEAALAGVLGHEIGHVIGHHSYKKMKKSLGDTLLIFAGLGAGLASGGGDATAAWVMATTSITQLSSAGYGRELELQADEFGMIYSYDAGYDPRANSGFFNTLLFKERISGAGYHGFYATHPDTMERVVKTREKSEIIASRGKPLVINRREYLEKIKGLTFGKGNRKIKKPPPYVLELYETKKGDTFRGIAKNVTGDESMGFEVAVINSKRVADKLVPGTLLKVPVKRRLAGADN
ncbi:MAG: M48 family metalloprotease [Nitrospinota bacterium]